MLFTDIDKKGNITIGVASAYNRPKIGHTRVYYDYTNSKSIMMYSSEVQRTYTVDTENTSFTSYESAAVEIYLTPDGNVKFKILDENGNKMAIIYPYDNDSSLENATVISRVELWADIRFSSTALFTISGTLPADPWNFYQEVYATSTGMATRSVESLNTTSGIHQELIINSVSLPTTEAINDLIDTTRDLSSESAAKYVSR